MIETVEAFRCDLARRGYPIQGQPGSRVFITDIQAAVSNYYHLPVAEMKSARRGRAVARPRQVAMYLSRQLTPRSLPEIGRSFGDRDHSTVIHAVRQIEKLMSDDGGLALAVETLTKQLTPDRGAPCIGRRG